jgi:hypothetical protein
MERTVSDVLGSASLALNGFDRDALAVFSQQFIDLSGRHPKKPISSQRENELREFLKKCALKISKESRFA